MRTLYLDCNMGAAGDMLAAALYELLDEGGRREFLDKMNALGLPGVRVAAETAARCGIQGTRMIVTAHGQEEAEHTHEHDHDHGHDHEHNHDHEHTHGHVHRGLQEIEEIISQFPLPEKIRSSALEVFHHLAEAESSVHGRPVTDIHFHEVGTLDAVADVTAVCLLVDMLAVGRIMASPIRVGYGHVTCAHGRLPVPAPATSRLLRDIPVYAGDIEGELCTPTGAALLKRFADSYGPMPAMRMECIGYGMGKKDFGTANCVRAILGEAEATDGETIAELTCNLDDMTPEAIGFAAERLREAGALEVYTMPAAMKKSRPGILFCVICRPEDRERLSTLVFRHTTTLGIREHLCRRRVLARRIDTVSTPLGNLRVKTAEGCSVSRAKYEYEDLAALARREGCSLAEILEKLPHPSDAKKH